MLNLLSCTAVDRLSRSPLPQRTYEFAFELDRTNGTSKPSEALNEIFVVYSKSWKNSSCCIGMIGPNDVNSKYLQDQICGHDDLKRQFRLWICASSNKVEGTGWLAESDLPPKRPDGEVEGQVMYAMGIGTVTTVTREYEALKSTAHIKDHLKKAIFCSQPNLSADAGGEIGDVDCASSVMMGVMAKDRQIEVKTDVSKPFSVSSTIWNHLSKASDSFQLSAISKIMSGKLRENIALIQGPPGTGKTSTIIGLVTALLNGSCPIPGPKGSGVRVQVGKSLFTAEKHMKRVTKNQSVCRILVCADSNAAVDELAWRLHKSAIGPDGKIERLKIIRFGMLPWDDYRDAKEKGRNKHAASFSQLSERDKFLHQCNLEQMTVGQSTRSSRQQVLSKCNIVCATLSGAGSKHFAVSIERDNSIMSEFDVVIIDEACQASEPACIIPLKYNPDLLVLVGDPQQLPVTIVSHSAEKAELGRSLFQRLQMNGWPVHMLRTQYRMHNEISRFPGASFYGGKLVASQEVERRAEASWHRYTCFPPYLVWNIHGPMCRASGGGIMNISGMFVA